MVALLAGPVWAASQARPASENLAERIARIETGLPTVEIQGEEPLRLSLDQWMKALDVPGVGIAVIDGYEVAWSRGFGIAATGSADPVTDRTLFQAGSIAKPVTALAALHMVEEGRLTLDGDINDSLTTWRLPESPLDDAHSVSLRGLLAHTGGVTAVGFPGYEVGQVTPTIPQILNGEPPSNTPATRVVSEPGSEVAYSGLGYTIVQLAMTEQGGQPFPQLMADTVFTPLGLVDSTFEQPLPDALAARAASGHDSSGNLVSGRWRVHPEMAAAGLWTTASDLGRILIEVARSKAGQSNLILSQTMTGEMLTQQKNEMSIGWVIRPGDPHGYFAHNGGTVGYRAHMRMRAGTGQGVVILTNSDNGSDLFNAIVASVAREYAWPDINPRPVMSWIAVRLIAEARGLDRALAEYRHMQATLSAQSVSVQDLNGWGYMLLGQGRVDDAIRVFSDNIGYYPDNPYAHNSLAEALEAAGRSSEAAEQYRRSLELNSEDNDEARQALERLARPI